MKFCFFSICIIALCFSKEAYAYIDPISGSIIFQALIAGFVGAMFFFKTYFYKIKSFFVKEKDKKPSQENEVSDKSGSNNDK